MNSPEKLVATSNTKNGWVVRGYSSKGSPTYIDRIVVGPIEGPAYIELRPFMAEDARPIHTDDKVDQQNLLFATASMWMVAAFPQVFMTMMTMAKGIGTEDMSGVRLASDRFADMAVALWKSLQMTLDRNR